MRTTLKTRLSFLARTTALASASAATLILAGCGGVFSPTASAPIAVAGTQLQGSVHGGQQPVSGSTIQLYAANQSGYGLQAFPLLTVPVATNSGGGFGISGDYTCPSATAPVYLVASGGNAGSGTNPALALMAALGPCGNLSNSTFIQMNELTTVGSAYALAQFMSSPTQLSTSATNVTGLANAFAGVNKLVSIGGGTIPGTLPAGATAPIAELNTLADIIASCVNSSGGASCSGFFTAATPPNGTAPTDTLTALIDIVKNPGNNASALFNMSSPTAPFQPTLTKAPTDFTVAVKYAPAGTFSKPSAAAVAANGDLWVTNATGNNVTILNAATSLPTTATGVALSGPSGIAFDAQGNAWVPNSTNSSLAVLTPAAVGYTVLMSNLSTPTAVAVDGQGLIWVTNSGSSSVTAVTANGTVVLSATNYTTGGISAPVAVAINTH